MKKLLILALLAMFMALPVMAQEKSPMRFAYGFCGFADNSFDREIDAGMKAGVITPIDAGKGLYLRPMYMRWNWKQNQPIQAVTIDVLMYYGLGKGFDIYALVAAESYTGGENSGTDPGYGLGIEKRLYTWEPTNTLVPGSIDLFAEVGYSDAGQQATGSTFQLQVGFLIGKAVSR